MNMDAPPEDVSALAAVPSHLGEHLERLHAFIDMLNKTLLGLGERLSPVLTTDVVNTPDRLALTSRSGYGESLALACARIDQIDDAVRALNSRLDLP